MLSKEAIDIVRPWCMSILEPELLEKDREIEKAKREVERAEKDGREKGIRAFASVCQEFGVSFADTVRRVAEDFELPEEVADAKVREYWQG